MCGRFTQRTPAAQVIEHFALREPTERQLVFLEPRYNVAPTQDVAAVRQTPESNGRELVPLRWGLIPSWSKDPRKGPPLINARGESIATKPAFRAAVRRRRCLIVADGFYEWHRLDGGSNKQASKKQPYYIHRPDSEPFAFAGLWETWFGGDSGGGPTIESCTIITTHANPMMSRLHDRMPVILSRSDYDLWLDPLVQDPAAVDHLIAPCDDNELVADPISTYVNNVKHEGPQCVART
jgi:putative SOS response-associated peptidase YedK